MVFRDPLLPLRDFPKIIIACDYRMARHIGFCTGPNCIPIDWAVSEEIGVRYDRQTDSLFAICVCVAQHCSSAVIARFWYQSASIRWVVWEKWKVCCVASLCLFAPIPCSNQELAYARSMYVCLCPYIQHPYVQVRNIDFQVTLW